MDKDEFESDLLQMKAVDSALRSAKLEFWCELLLDKDAPIELRARAILPSIYWITRVGGLTAWLALPIFKKFRKADKEDQC